MAGLPLEVISSLARDVFALDRNWLYGGRSVPGCTDPGFDDEGYRFVSIYRRHFTLPAVPIDRRIFVDFEGVMAAATVTLNDETLGEHRGGYATFSFEISGRVRRGEDNVLAVEEDSTEREDIPPFGGIYREVALRIVPDTFVENVFAKWVDVFTEKHYP